MKVDKLALMLILPALIEPSASGKNMGVSRGESSLTVAAPGGGDANENVGDSVDKYVERHNVVTLYDFAFFADDGNIVVSAFTDVDDYNISDKWGMIDTSGNVIVDGTGTWLIPSRDELAYMHFPNSAGYTCFMKEGSDLIGIFDKSYKEHLPPSYQDLTLFGEYAVGGNNAVSGKDIIHIPSKKIVGHIDDTYEIIDVSEDMVLAVDDNYEPYFLDCDGNIVISSAMIDDYKILHGFREGRATVGNDERMGFIDKKGNIVIPPDYEYFGDLWLDEMEFKNGTIIVMRDGKYGVIDVNGKVVIPFNYYEIIRYDDSGSGKFLVKEAYDDQCYFLFYNDGSKVGKFTPGNSPEEWEPFRDEETDLEGYNSYDGTVMLPPAYYFPSYFFNGYALVGIDKEGICLIDSKGRILIKRLARRNQAMLPG